jgi:hypothetical protein
MPAIACPPSEIGDGFNRKEERSAMRNSYLLCCIVLGALAIACAARVGSSDEKKTPATVRAEDLCNGNCIIVGRLGKPYGEVSKVRGIWELDKKDPPKPEGPWLRITHIDGKKLADDQQIVVNRGFVKSLKGNRGMEEYPPGGQVIEGRVYEFGGYPEEWPPKIREALGLPHFPAVQPRPEMGFFFHSFLYFID